MKTWMAFLVGAALATLGAILVLKRQQPQTEPAAIEQTATQNVPQTPLQPPAETPLEKPPEQKISGKPSAASGPSRPAKPRTPAAPPVAEREPATPPAANAPVAQPVPAPAPTPPATSPDPGPALAPPRASEPATPAKPAPPPEPRRVTVAAGTLISVRLAETISSDVVEPGAQFRGTLDQPLIVDGWIIAERGARVEGRVSKVEKAGKVRGVAHLALELTHLVTVDGQRVSISTAAWEKEGEQSRKSDAAKVAAGAGIGAALGAIFGGGKGAAIGAGSGAAAGTGVVLATRGKPVTLPVETRITFRLKDPVTITESR